MRRLRMTGVALAVLSLWFLGVAAAMEESGPSGPSAGMEAPAPEMERAAHLDREARALMEASERHAEAGAEREAAELKRRATEMMREAKEIRAHAALRMGGGFGSGGFAGVGVPFELMPEAAGPRVAIVPSGDMPEPQIAELTEDLSIMSRVLEKALRHAVGEEYLPRPGGAFAPLFDGGQRQALYMQGYGAVFVMSVRFPLAGPTRRAEEERPPEPPSLWDETRRELQAGAPWEARFVGPLTVHGAIPGGPVFDPERVERLKNVILETLREGANIRGLKGEDSLSVVVLAEPPVAITLTSSYGGAQRGGGMDVKPEAPRAEAMVVHHAVPNLPQALTLHAKKADIDGFAKGKLNLEEFRKRVTISLR